MGHLRNLVRKVLASKPSGILHITISWESIPVFFPFKFQLGFARKSSFCANAWLPNKTIYNS